MTLHLPSDISQSIEGFLATGRYATAEAVLREAINALRQRDEDFAAIAAGIADVEAGRYRPFAESDAEFREQHGLPRSA